MKDILFLIFLAMSVSSAQALDCNNAMTQADINECAANDYRNADAQLNRVYTEVRKKVDPAQQIQLKNVQNAWIKFRDLDCEFQTSSVKGGSLYSATLASCLTQNAIDRTKALETLLHCEEGDPTCVLSGK